MFLKRCLVGTPTERDGRLAEGPGEEVRGPRRASPRQRKKPWVILAVLWLAGATCWAGAKEHYQYLLEEGSSARVKITWLLERGEAYELTVVKGGETHVSRHDGALATLEWEFLEPARNTMVTARREGDRIELRGTYRGRAVRRSLEIDHAPWYQAISLSLRPFSIGAASEVEFWTLRPDTFSVYRVRARKAGTELIAHAGQKVETVKVVIRLAGAKEILWHGSYWYRVSDGLFMRYEGATGLFGAGKCTISLIGTQDNRLQSGCR